MCPPSWSCWPPTSSVSPATASPARTTCGSIYVPFSALDTDPAHLLLVGTDGADVIATMQLSFLPGLARRGALRAQIEAVRVRKDYRNQGLGAAMFLWAIGEARRRCCALVQLTTDKSRVDAHRFYERLGFTDSHEGLKLKI